SEKTTESRKTAGKKQGICRERSRGEQRDSRGAAGTEPENRGRETPPSPCQCKDDAITDPDRPVLLDHPKESPGVFASEFGLCAVAEAWSAAPASVRGPAVRRRSG